MLHLLLPGILKISMLRSFAYIDPGTGNMAVQILMALFAGGVYVICRFWSSLKKLIAGIASTLRAKLNKCEKK